MLTNYYYKLCVDDIKFYEKGFIKRPVGLDFNPSAFAARDQENAYAILIQDVQQIGIWKHSIFFIIVLHSLGPLSVISGN